MSTRPHAGEGQDSGFIRGNERIERILERPDVGPQVRALTQEWEQSRREYIAGLTALRQAAELTQNDLADKLQVSQAAVSRMEQPHDMLLSTLGAYISALGGKARMVVDFGQGREVELDLSSLKPGVA